MTPEFLAINPNNKIPALVDPQGPNGQSLTLWESGAILTYLAEKYGKFIPKHGTPEYYHVLQWTFFQVGGPGPMFGQLNHFKKYAPEVIPYGINRYAKETVRLLGVVEGQLSKSAYLAGSEYTIADMMLFPWIQVVRDGLKDVEGIDFAKLPHTSKWLETCMARDGTKRALKKLGFPQ